MLDYTRWCQEGDLLYDVFEHYPGGPLVEPLLDLLPRDRVCQCVPDGSVVGVHNLRHGLVTIPGNKTVKR